jgi:hypothetical protein
LSELGQQQAALNDFQVVLEVQPGHKEATTWVSKLKANMMARLDQTKSDLSELMAA